MDSPAIVSLTVTIFLALLGFLVKYLNDLKLTQRKEQLQHIENQLRDFYGPLFAISKALSKAYESFRSFYRPGIPYWNAPESDPTRTTTPEEVAAFHLWMEEVFMPLDRQLVQIIVHHSDLLEESELPQCLSDLLAHISAYEGIIKEWDLNNYSHHTPLIRYPTDEFPQYVSMHYHRLKNLQAKLQGRKIRKQNIEV
jgi:hypothetical protein